MESLPMTMSEPSAPAPVKSLPFHYDGEASRFYLIYLKSIPLTLLTVGIYRFWFKTELRRYQASCYSLLGDRFEYTGTPMEMLRGFLIALPIFLLLTAPLYFIDPITSRVDDLLSMVLLYLAFVGQYAALRYRLSRMVWRGIRGRLRGSAFTYGGLVVIRYIGTAASLGFLAPMLDMAVWRYKVQHASFGEAPLAFDGSEKGLQKVNIWTILLFPFTLGLSRLWYKAALLNRQFDGTTFSNLRLGASYTGRKLLGLYGSNALLFICTLGLALPYIVHRNARFLAANVQFYSQGDADFGHVRQSEEQLGRSGEGLDQIFDADIGFG